MDTTNNQQATQNEIGWLAGIIDGEGYLGLRWNLQRHRKKRYAQPQMHIANTDEAIILRCQSIIRKLGLNPYIRARQLKFGNRKIDYRIQLKNMSKVMRLLKAVRNDLTGNKKQRADIIIQFCEIRLERWERNGTAKYLPYTEKELQLIEQCQPLMKRGASETTREAERQRSVIINQKLQVPMI